MTTKQKQFDLDAARGELDALKRRARELERAITDELRAKLRTLFCDVGAVRATEELLEDARRFSDEQN